MIDKLLPRVAGIFVAALTLGPRAPAQNPGYPGATTWGQADYVEYTAGNLPIVLSSGHGGALTPAGIPDRTWGVLTQDLQTQNLTRELAAEIVRRTGRQPHVVISHLHRRKLDPNRDIVEAAQGDPQAERAWREYHGFLELARNTIERQSGKGLYLDVHGHGHPETWIEWGYALSAQDLGNGNAVLNTAPFIDKSTLRNLARQPGIVFAEIVRGAQSFGGLMQALGYQGVPSPAHPGPSGGNYFSGGYSVQRHGSRDGGTVDAVQIELPAFLRRDVPVRRAMVPRLVQSIDDFLTAHYGLDLDAEPRVTITATAPWTTETGAPAAFSIARTGDLGQPLTVVFTVGGTATAGADYQALPSSVSIPAGKASVALPVAPLEDATDEGSETVSVRLFGGVEIGQPSLATVVIRDEGSDPLLLARWTMDEVQGGQVPDATGHGHAAALWPSAPLGPRLAPGHRSGALSFDEVDDHLRVPDFDQAPAGAFTLSFFFRVPPSPQSAYQYAVGHDAFGSASSLNVWFVESTGELRSNLQFENNQTPTGHLDVFEDYMDDRWHHYALVARPDGLSAVLVDGAERATGAFSGDRYDPRGPLHLGTREDLPGDHFFGGLLDEVRCYGRALDPAEVRLLARERPGRFEGYGIGCPGANGVPQVAGEGVPEIDRRVGFALYPGPASSAAFLALGVSRTSWNGAPLPFSLAVLGAPGCFVWQDLVDAVPTATSAGGTAEVAIRFPREPRLIGAHLYGQFLVLDPAANPLGLAATGGLEVELGGIE